MSALIARLKKRSTYSPSASQHSQSHAASATPIGRLMPGAWSEMSPLERKIHPNLESLVTQDAMPIFDIGPSATPKDSTALSFVPLLPSTRKPSTTQYLKDPSDNNSDVGQPSRGQADKTIQRSDENPHQQLQPCTPIARSTSLPEAAAPSVDAACANISGDTFGGEPKLTYSHAEDPNHVLSDTRPITPATPDADSQVDSDTRARDNSSSGSYSNSPHKLESITPSPHTFGIPTPPSSGFTFGTRRRRTHVSSETPPPLPPLDHPAFQSSSVSSNVNDSRVIRIFTVPGLRLEKDDEQTKHPRHASSLPSMSHRAQSSNRSPNHGRERARTQSRVKKQETSPVIRPMQSTPRRNFRHSRTQSKESNNSGRRASAEFSAAQAVIIGDGNNNTESWEAQVSREMVQMSFGEKLRPRSPKDAGVAELGKARGNNSSRPTALGSPFFFQYTSISSGTAPDDNTTGSDLVRAGSEEEHNITTMSKDASVSRFSETAARRGQSKSPERIRTPSPPPPKITAISHSAAPSSSHLMPPSLSLTAPTPDASPVTPIKRTGHRKAATEPPPSVLQPSTPPIVRSASPSSPHKGKRKADEADVEGGNTPPKDQPRATFALGPRPHRASGNSASSRATNSGSSRAPSSYHRKRAKLSTTPESRPGSRASVDAQNAQNAATTGSWSSKASSRHIAQPPRPTYQQPHQAPSRRSFSQSSIPGSIPMSALISPHAPSIQGSSVFHMRDPRKPPPVQTTPWSLSLPSSGDGSWLERGGSPLHAWLFFVGFLIFPLWWIAAFVGIPRTRRLGSTEVEKGVVLDDPQVESDAKSWRKRCRIMAVVSLFTYIPFIILVAIFVK